jgi:hypothetical protein
MVSRVVGLVVGIRVGFAIVGFGVAIGAIVGRFVLTGALVGLLVGTGLLVGRLVGIGFIVRTGLFVGIDVGRFIMFMEGLFVGFFVGGAVVGILMIASKRLKLLKKLSSRSESSSFIPFIRRFRLNSSPSDAFTVALLAKAKSSMKYTTLLLIIVESSFALNLLTFL